MTFDAVRWFISLWLLRLFVHIHAKGTLSVQVLHLSILSGLRYDDMFLFYFHVLSLTSFYLIFDSIRNHFPSFEMLLRRKLSFPPSVYLFMLPASMRRSLHSAHTQMVPFFHSTTTIHIHPHSHRSLSFAHFPNSYCCIFLYIHIVHPGHNPHVHSPLSIPFEHHVVLMTSWNSQYTPVSMPTTDSPHKILSRKSFHTSYMLTCFVYP